MTAIALSRQTQMNGAQKLKYSRCKFNSTTHSTTNKWLWKFEWCSIPINSRIFKRLNADSDLRLVIYLIYIHHLLFHWFGTCSA